jgi:hypothetical protein
MRPSKNLEKKKVVFSFLVMILLGSYAYGQNAETVSLPESVQSRKDVIVVKGKYFGGFQTKIMNIDNTHIYYIKYKTKGREKEKKINQRKIAFTLTFNEKNKQEYYPVQMNLQDYLSLPTYNLNGNWIVFGTGFITNLPQLQNIHPDICNDFTKGVKLSRVAGGMYSISYLLGGIPLIIAGTIVESTGKNKINDAFVKYYNTCVNLEVCNKYGIVITPYNFDKTINLK